MKLRTTLTILLMMLLAAFLPRRANAVTYNSPTALAPDIQSNVNLTIDGDTVTVPSGGNVWTVAVSVTKAITLIATNSHTTWITNGVAGNNPYLTLFPTSSNQVRLIGFNFVDTNSAGSHGGVQISGQGYRICTNTFNTAGVAVGVYDPASGVIDHCAFGPGTGSQVAINGSTNAWSVGPQFGTTNFTCIEDCSFAYPAALFSTGDGALDAYNGANYVFRHNMVTNTYVGHHGADSGTDRSTHACEVYDNFFVWNAPGNMNTVLQSRGGTGVYWGNTNIISGGNNWNEFLQLQCYRYFSTNSNCHSSLFDCPPWGEMTGSNRWDGNTLADCTPSDGYPGLDQVGRTGPTTINSSSVTQVLSPVYEWSNTFSGGGFVFGYVVVTETNILQNRDYYTNTVAPGYTNLVYPHPLVQAPPDPFVTLQPTDQTVTAPATATFTCAFSGATWPGTIQWFKNGVSIGGATSGSYTTPATTVGDDGTQFYARGTDTAGTVQTAAVTLHVNGSFIFGGASVPSSASISGTISVSGKLSIGQ